MLLIRYSFAPNGAAFYHFPHRRRTAGGFGSSEHSALRAFPLMPPARSASRFGSPKAAIREVVGALAQPERDVVAASLADLVLG